MHYRAFLPNISSNVCLKLLASCTRTFHSSRNYFWKRRIMGSEHVPEKYFFISCDEETAMFTFAYTNVKEKMVKMYLNRKLTEPWVSTVSRLAIKLHECDIGKMKRKRKNKDGNGDNLMEESEKIDVDKKIKILQNGEVVECNQSQTNQDVMNMYPELQFQIKDVVYNVLLNKPHAAMIKLPAEIYCGLPVMASIDLENAGNADELVHWFVSDAMGIEAMKTDADLQLVESDNARKFIVPGWTHRHTGFVYEPCEADIDRRICAVCDLGPQTIASCFTSSKVVRPLPFSDFIFLDRQKACAKPVNGQMFRFVCYNVLADLYMDLKLAQKDCWFAYCPKEYQDPTYRYPVLLKELQGYNFDIMCLQEVDYKLYLRYLNKFMKVLGFDCSMCLKGFAVNEGLVTIYKSDRFRLKEEHNLFLVDELSHETNSDIFKLVSQTQECLEFMQNRPTMFQVTVLVDENGAHFVIGNTHLPSDRFTPHIRLIHVAMCLRAVQRICNNLQGKVHVIFSGDLNSVPTSAVVELLKTGSIPADHPEWDWPTVPMKVLEANVTFDPVKHTRPQPGPLPFKGMQLNAGRSYSCASGFSKYTNYTYTFQEVIDYVWIDSDSLECTRALPPPDEQKVNEFIAIPSKAAPSDHVPLICDLKMKN